MRRTIEVRAGSRARERITLVATGRAPASGLPVEPPRGRTIEGDGNLIGGAIGGYAVAGAGLVVMAIFGGLTAAEHGQLTEGCGATRSCTPAAVSDANAFALVSDVGLGVALTGAAVGTILLAMGLSAGGSGEHTTLIPWVAPDSAGGMMRARF